MVIAQGVKIKDLFEVKVFDVNMSSFAFPSCVATYKPSISSTNVYENISYIHCPFGEQSLHLLILTPPYKYF